MKRGNYAVQFKTNAGATSLNHLSAKCDKHPPQSDAKPDLKE